VKAPVHATPSRTDAAGQHRATIVRAARPGAAFLVLGTGQVVLILAITMLSVALPAIQRYLHLNQTQLVLASASYGLSFSGLLLLGGRLADLLGRRRVFVTGMAVFGVASAVGGLAPGTAALLGARFAQGAGAALAAPAAMALIGTVFPDARRRAHATAIWGSLASFGATAGIVYSGAFVTWLSWRWIFALPALVAAVVVLAARSLIPAGPSPAEGRIDLAGATLATVGLSVLSYGLVAAGNHPWLSAAVAGPCLAGVGLLVCFAVAESRAAEPLLPLSFLTSPRRIVALWTMLLGAAAMSTIFFMFSLYFQNAHGRSALWTSASFLPFGLTLIAAGSSMGHLLARWSTRLVTSAGLLTAAAGLALLGRTDEHSGYAGTVLAGLIVFPLGMAGVFSGGTVAATEGVPEEQAGLAGGVVNTAMEIGPTVGLAVLASLAATHTGDLLRSGAGHTAATVGGYSYAFDAAAVLFAVTALVTAIAMRHRTDSVAY
jgi:MFS family permease